MTTTPTAIIAAQRLIRREAGRSIPDHRIRLSLSTEPDQYEVRYTSPRPSEDGMTFALIPRLTLAESQFKAWEAWLDARYPGGRP